MAGGREKGGPSMAPVVGPNWEGFKGEFPRGGVCDTAVLPEARITAATEKKTKPSGKLKLPGAVANALAFEMLRGGIPDLEIKRLMSTITTNE